jgi:hypothetical protein
MSHVSGESTSSPARDEEEDEVKVFNHDDEEEDEINVQEVKEEVNKRQELLNEFKKGLIDENEKKTSSSSHHHHQGSSSTSTSNASTTQSSSSKSNSSLSSSALTPAFPSLYPFPPHPFHHHPNGSLESMVSTLFLVFLQLYYKRESGMSSFSKKVSVCLKEKESLSELTSSRRHIC